MLKITQILELDAKHRVEGVEDDIYRLEKFIKLWFSASWVSRKCY